MPRRAPELECSIEDKADLVAIVKSGTAEARVVDRARIILACLEGKEIQQVARELRISVPSVTKWRECFSLWGLRGLRDQSRPGKPVRYLVLTHHHMDHSGGLRTYVAEGATIIVAALLMLMLGVSGTGGVLAVLGVAAVVCVSSAVAGELLQDFKVGYILGGTPRSIQPR